MPLITDSYKPVIQQRLLLAQSGHILKEQLMEEQQRPPSPLLL